MNCRFQILGSSSSGNCAFLQTADAKILIDAGFSGRRTAEMLEEIGERPDDLDAIFLTHEHSDHINGLRGLSRFKNLKIFANHYTAEAARRGLRRNPEWGLFESGTTFTFRDLEISSFSIPHDSSDPVGFVFQFGGQDLFNPVHRIGWVLDLGYATNLVKERIAKVDTLVIEANHDHQLLRLDQKRPWQVKQRIGGRQGHLSNEACCETLTEIQPHSSWKKVILGHLSGDCNNLECIRKAFSPFIGSATVPFAFQVVDGEGNLHELR
ncbi:MAG: MBL fold metallo-hydrolase [Opitutales bacterium]|nr:MBL fold metallo-hydrolase [Opitutales bacterium]MCH8539340.1 MBL fold metallo-hydrolase [Opitutales bacterium]